MKSKYLLVGMSLLVGCQTGKPLYRETKAKKEHLKFIKQLSSDPKVDFDRSKILPVVGTRGMVAVDSREAALWGAEILRRGGNAIDAAVATGWMMAVTRPQHGTIGGGGFMIYCPASFKKGKCRALNFREKAPQKAHRNVYVVDGKPRTDLSQNHPMASGVPGIVDGYFYALKKWGTRSHSELMKKPIEVAENGFVFTGELESSALDRWSSMNPEAKKIFGCNHGKVSSKPCRPGKKVIQKDLSRVLKTISQKGRKGFYEGWVAQKIVKGLRRKGGMMSLKDLQSYRSVEMDPIQGDYLGYQIFSMPPPSAGGAMIAQMFQYVKHADENKAFENGDLSSQTVHALSHAMNLSFADRAVHFGDPDFYPVPLKKLMDPAYLKERWESTYHPNSAYFPQAGGIHVSEGQHTTHFAVIDKKGNAVSITITQNNNYGSGFVPPGTGIVMNNEMDDFSIQPGTPNLFGLVGSEANAVAPEKRPLSSMSPTIVTDSQGRPRIALGAAGGPTITTSVFLTLVRRMRLGLTLPDAMMATRFHQQWKPKTLFVERNGFSDETLGRLQQIGYSLREKGHIARMHAIERYPDGTLWGVSDRRSEGAAVPEPL